jgi:hypothetical protein
LADQPVFTTYTHITSLFLLAHFQPDENAARDMANVMGGIYFAKTNCTAGAFGLCWMSFLSWAQIGGTGAPLHLVF